MNMIDRREMRAHIFVWVVLFSIFTMLGAYKIGHMEGVKSTSIVSYEEKIVELTLKNEVLNDDNKKMDSLLRVSIDLLEQRGETLDKMSNLLDQCLDLRQ